jgi:hypothetical protein
VVKLLPDAYLAGARNLLKDKGVSGLDADHTVSAIGLANRAAWRFENHGRVDLDKWEVAVSLAFPDLGVRPAPLESSLGCVVQYMLRQCTTDGGVIFTPHPVGQALREWARREGWGSRSRSEAGSRGGTG